MKKKQIQAFDMKLEDFLYHLYGTNYLDIMNELWFPLEEDLSSFHLLLFRGFK